MIINDNSNLNYHGSQKNQHDENGNIQKLSNPSPNSPSTPSISTSSTSVSSFEASSSMSTCSTSTAINSSHSNNSLIGHGIKSVDVSSDLMQHSVPKGTIQSNHPIQSPNNSHNRSFSQDSNNNHHNNNKNNNNDSNNNNSNNSNNSNNNSYSNSNTWKSSSDFKAVSSSHSTINSSSDSSRNHKSLLTLSTATPVASSLLHLLPVEPYVSPSCLELLHRLCVGPASDSLGAAAVGTVNGERCTGGGREGGREGDGNRDSSNYKEKEFSDRDTDIKTDEAGKFLSKCDTKLLTNSDLEKSNRRAEGQSLEGQDNIYSDTQSSLYRPVRQSDCDLSQKIGFTKQLEFIHKLTNLVENLRFVDRLQRTESLCAGLAKINESPEDLGVWIAAYTFVCILLCVNDHLYIFVCLSVCLSVSMIVI